MKIHKVFLRFGLVIVIVFSLSFLKVLRVDGASINLTPGDKIGADHTAYFFSPAYWMFGDSGEDAYIENVGKDTGQQYEIDGCKEEKSRIDEPNPVTLCGFPYFYDLIHNKGDSLGTLLITSHGGNDEIVVETFPHTPAGLTARDSAYKSYRDMRWLNKNDELVFLTDFDIRKGGTSVVLGTSFYGIAVYSKFVRDFGKLNQSLVYVNTCEGASLNDAFVAAGARVSVGVKKFGCSGSGARSVVRKFFENMNGKNGQDKRPVRAAATSLGTAGSLDTTLAPSVNGVIAPCPISQGDKVRFFLDTAGNTAIIPTIGGEGVVIVKTAWIGDSIVEGEAVSLDGSLAKVYDYKIILFETWLLSAQNEARLDGNTKPADKNAEGPAHDNFIKHIECKH